MVFKVMEEKVLHDAEEFYVRKARPDEKDVLHEMFRRYIDKKWWSPAENSLALVAVEKKTGRIIGGIEREFDLKERSADGSGLVVLPEFQWKGIGAQLVPAIDGELGRMGVKRITTTAGSDYAFRIFMKNNYKIPPDIRSSLVKDGLPEDKFVKPLQMVREL